MFKLFVVLVMAVVYISMWVWEITTLDLHGAQIFLYGLANFMLWVLTSAGTLIESWKPLIGIPLVLIPVCWQTYKIKNPNTAAGMELQHQAADIANGSKAMGSIVDTISDQPCEEITEFFGVSRVTNRKIALVGYTHQNGRWLCYNIRDRLVGRNVDARSGAEILEMTPDALGGITSQIEREKKEAKKLAAAQKAAEEAEAANKFKAAAVAEQQRSQETAQSISTVAPTQAPKERCAADNKVEIFMGATKTDLTKKYVFQVHLQSPLYDENNQLLVERAAPVVLTINRLQQNFNGYADLDMEVTSIGDATIHSRVRPVKLWPDKRGGKEYSLMALVTLPMIKPICLPTEATVTASLR